MAAAQGVRVSSGGGASPKTDERASRRAIAIAEVKQLLIDMTGKTNKLTAELNVAKKSKAVLKALDGWANYLDKWKSQVKALEGRQGFELLKAAEPPEELKRELDVFMASITNMSATLQAKVENFKGDPSFQKRINQVLGKLKDM
ncbi:hypothetical protein [Turneriella parva]|nr:hypothetical protein [Turneriella parva]